MRVLAGACLALGIACNATVARAAVVVVASGRPASTAGEFDTEYGVWSLDLDTDGDYDFGFSFHSGCVSSAPQDHGPPLKISYHKRVDPEVMDGYIAFRLPAEGEAWRYGYLHFDYRRWPLPPGGSEITGDPILVGWAYESIPDTPILVQRIPEPAVMLLTLTAVGGAVWRRRL